MSSQANTKLTPDALSALRRLGDVSVDPSGNWVAFVVSAPADTGSRVDAKVWLRHTTDAGAEPVRITGNTDATEAMPTWSPDGRLLAFACDASQPGVLGPWIRDASGAVHGLSNLTGMVEQMQWSSDARHLLALVADAGSDRQGAGAGVRVPEIGDSNDPVVRRPRQFWRRLCRIEVATGDAVQVSPDGVNIWEFGWNGAGPAVAIVSADPHEGAWYDATLALLDLDAVTSRDLYHP
jgi:dipeptidyl aminopeptidase/acylaminoacyl peptidase